MYVIYLLNTSDLIFSEILFKKSIDRLYIISCVIQKNNDCSFVGTSETAKELSCLNTHHQDIDKNQLTYSLSEIGLQVIKEMSYKLPNNKEFIRVDFRTE